MINLLLEKGADLTSSTPNGLTALLLAIYNGHIASANLLLEYEVVDVGAESSST